MRAVLSGHPHRLGLRHRLGFTLIELLVVITIIGIVSALLVPTTLSTWNHRQVGEAARAVQGTLVGARDQAIHDNAPAGIRLLPDPSFPLTWLPSGRIDPTQPLVFNAVIPIEPAPEYTEGAASVYPGQAYAVAITGGLPALVVEESVGKWVLPPNAARYTFQPNPPTSWMWNARLGDKIRFSDAGPWYTVVGPTVDGPVQGNPELFANVGKPGTASPLSRTVGSPDGQSQVTQPEFLLLVNGSDDNGNGWTDEGWDGVDNNGINGVDEAAEWEAEHWLGSMATLGQVDQPYALRRRPVPVMATRATPLPGGVVVDATTWQTTRERSRLPVNPFTGYCDILVNPSGTVVPTTLYGVPTSVGMDGAFLHLWLAEKGDIYPPGMITGQPFALPTPKTSNPTYPGPYLKGQYHLVTLFTRTGAVVSTDEPPFDDPANPVEPLIGYQPNLPYKPAQQGAH